jgi:hypothetical protein
LRAEQVLAPAVDETGIGAPPSNDVRSPETYLGYQRQEGFASRPSLLRDAVAKYREPETLAVNQWSASGDWDFMPEMALLSSAGGALSFHFFARDVNLVLGAPQGSTIRYRVRVNGKPPGGDHGEDTDAQGQGVVREYRLYQLLRQKQGDQERVITIEFLDKGAQAFAFTFG